MSIISSNKGWGSTHQFNQNRFNLQNQIKVQTPRRVSTNLSISPAASKKPFVDKAITGLKRIYATVSPSPLGPKIWEDRRWNVAEKGVPAFWHGANVKALTDKVLGNPDGSKRMKSDSAVFFTTHELQTPSLYARKKKDPTDNLLNGKETDGLIVNFSVDHVKDWQEARCYSERSVNEFGRSYVPSGSHTNLNVKSIHLVNPDLKKSLRARILEASEQMLEAFRQV